MSKPKFQESEKVLCFHGVLLYEAKILEVDTKEKPPKYLVHYQGWNKNWDEYVLEKRILKFNEQGLAKQKELRQANVGKRSSRLFRDNCAKPSGTAESSSVEDGEGGGPSANTEPPTPTAASNTDSSSALPSSSTNTTNEKVEKAEKAEKAPTTATTTTNGLGSAVPKKGPPSESGQSDSSSVITQSETSNSKRRKTVASVPKEIPAVETEDAYLSKLEVRIKIPDELNVWLVDDWDLVTRQRKLVTLPASKSVDAILDEYYTVKSERAGQLAKTTLTELVQGIRDYFNVMLGSQLLYKFERPQYSDLLTEHPDSSLSQLYGAVHLLRLFVRLGSMLVYTQLDEKSMQQLLHQLHDFLKWYSINSSRFFSHSSYMITTPEYQRRAV